MVSGSRPAVAWSYAASSWDAASSTCTVPLKTRRGSAPDRSPGSRRSTMLTFSCEPEGCAPGSAPVSSASTLGAAPQTTWPASAAAGQLPDVIPFEVYCHSLTDPSILGPVERATGHHTLTLFGLHTPADLYRADPPGTRREAVRRVLTQLDAHLEEPLLDCLARDSSGRPCLQAASPVDVEASLAMPGGHIFHGDLAWPVARTPDEVGTWGVATTSPRIVSASSGGTVRGGAVSGLGGYAAARTLLDRC